MNYHSQDTDDSTNGQTARIAHEYLGGISIIPQETYQSTDKCTDKDYQFLRFGYIHDVQITSILDMTGNVSQQA